MIRKKKRYSRPKKAYEISRIKEENALLKRYALKNKLEVWKNIAQVDYFRRRAKSLAKSSLEEQNILFNKLKALGLNTNAISDVLALKIEDLLDRKLPTVIFKKGIAKTIQEARQMIVHKRILIDNKIVNSPNYIVSLAEEGLISLKTKQQKEKAQDKADKKTEAPLNKEQNVNSKVENIGERPFGRFGRTRKKRTHVFIKVKEKSEIKKPKDEKKEEDKK